MSCHKSELQNFFGVADSKANGRYRREPTDDEGVGGSTEQRSSQVSCKHFKLHQQAKKESAHSEDEAIEKTTNKAKRSDIKEKIRVAMEKQCIVKEQEPIAKEKQSSKAELWNIRLENGWNAKLVSSEILYIQKYSFDVLNVLMLDIFPRL